MGSLVGLMGSTLALSSGLRSVFFDSRTAVDRQSEVEHERRWPTAKNRPDRWRVELNAWRRETEGWVRREIANGTDAGAYLDARRAHVLAALGIGFEEALQQLTTETTERGE